MTIWLERLEQYEREGFREVPGAPSNPKIIKWMRGPGGGDWVKSDATPWCGGCMAGILDECGLGHAIPKEPLAAISWLRCGVACEPKPGAIAIFPRDGGNHVTVIKRIRGHVWDCIGGNQGDAIKTSEFDGRMALGTRWPIAKKTPKELAAESRIAKAAQRQKRDKVKTTVSLSTAPATQSAPPPDAPQSVPGWREQMDSWVSDLTWAKQVFGYGADLGGFIGQHWWLIACGLAAYYFARSWWDSQQIAEWRTQDHNEGYTQL